MISKGILVVLYINVLKQKSQEVLLKGSCRKLLCSNCLYYYFFNANSVPCFVLLGEIPWVDELCVSLETPQCPAG